MYNIKFDSPKWNHMVRYFVQSHPNRSIKVIVCIGNKGDDDMSRRKAENGMIALTNSDNKSDKTEEMLRHLLGVYLETDDKKYWNAARAVAGALNLEYYLGAIPHEVESLINHISKVVEMEAKSYYCRIENELGFIPMNVRQRKIFDLDDAYETTIAQAIYLAKTQGNSVKNRLRTMFNHGVWNGQGGKELEGLFTKHLYYHMEGCYSEDDY
jgi:hypothetical protein